MTRQKRTAALCAALAALLSCVCLPAAFASAADGGHYEIREYDLIAEAVAIGYLNPDLTVNRDFVPPSVPEPTTASPGGPTGTSLAPLPTLPLTETTALPEEPEGTTGETPAAESTETPTEPTDTPTEPTASPDEETAAPTFPAEEDGPVRPNGLLAAARAYGLDDRQFYDLLARSARQGAQSVAELFDLEEKDEPSSPQAYSSAAQTKVYSKNFEYYDADGKLLWSTVLLANYRVTPNAAVCLSASPLFRSEDDRWRLAGDPVPTVSGSRVSCVFTVKKTLLGIATATVERALELFVTPEGLYRYDPAQLHKGDVNFNAKTDAADARLALRFSARLVHPDARGFIAADYDSDGSVTSADARAILRKAAKL